MTEQAPRRSKNRTTGIILIILGCIGITTRFTFGNDDWNTVSILKISVSVLCIGMGLFNIFRKTPS